MAFLQGELRIITIVLALAGDVNLMPRRIGGKYSPRVEVLPLRASGYHESAMGG